MYPQVILEERLETAASNIQRGEAADVQSTCPGAERSTAHLRLQLGVEHDKRGGKTLQGGNWLHVLTRVNSAVVTPPLGVTSLHPLVA